jgi:hypothetical protein
MIPLLLLVMTTVHLCYYIISAESINTLRLYRTTLSSYPTAIAETDDMAVVVGSFAPSGSRHVGLRYATVR